MDVIIDVFKFIWDAAGIALALLGLLFIFGVWFGKK
jgi:hypothetical protein